MIRFKVGKAEESTITAWYNTKEGISEKLKSLDGLNELCYERHVAGYQREENLSEFYILGNWSLDSCGNCSKADRDIKKLFPEIPDVMTREEFWQFIKSKYPDDEHFSIGYSHDDGLPLSHLICPICGKGCDISNCYDTIVYRDNSKEKVVNLKDFVGKRLAEVQMFFNEKTDAIYRMNQPEMIIRNDKFIDLTLDPAHEEYNAKHPDHPIVKNQSGWLGEKDGIDGDYIVKEGDEGYFNIWRYYHRTCNRQRVNQNQLEEFQRIFEKAGWNNLDPRFLAIPNQYCPCDICASWYNVNTKFGTGILIGWRKRVINIDWSAWGIDFNYLFKGEDVTKWNGGIHAWGEEKAIEYLSKIRQELNRPEIADKIPNCLEKKINKAATIQNVLDWISRSVGHSINVEKFNAAMEAEDWEKNLVDMATFCQVEIVYL